MNFIVTSVVLLVIAGRRRCLCRQERVRRPGSVDRRPRTSSCAPSTGVAEIADQLERRGLISDARIFRLGVRAYGKDAALKAGEYEIKAGASMREIMELLKSGKSILYSLTMPGGPDRRAGVPAHRRARGADRRHAGRDAARGQPASPTRSASRAAPRASRSSTRWPPTRSGWSTSIWARRAPDLPIADINEFVTLASIVEKETGTRRRALACRRRLHQPAEQGHAAAVRPDDHLRPLRRRGKAGRPADLPVRHRQADALQHLS